MNKKKVLVVAFFLVVFGMPLAWYLFLQMFGENQFALPEYGRYTSTCELPLNSAVVLLDEKAAERQPNERQRVINRLMELGEVQFIETNMDSCKLSYEMNLVDHDKVIRGVYDFNREEVDRFMAEVDIYILNYQNGTSTNHRIQ
ncbi:MAG: hypothetical protein RIC35_07550 [Marinoscillum sp.]